MNFKGNFIKLANVDCTALRRRVQALAPDHWLQDAWRQEEYAVHRATHTIGLIFDKDFRHTNSTVHPAYHGLEPELRPLLGEIRRHYNGSIKAKRLYKKNGPGYFVRINLAKLLPGGSIPEHMDTNFSLTHSHRIHVPVVTNDQVVFSVGGETMKLGEGEVWEINNKKAHWVENKGVEARVHLIVDWVIPGEACCCGRRLHPKTPCSTQVCAETSNMPQPCRCHI